MASDPPNRLGVVIYALALHQRLRWPQADPPLPPCLQFLETCQQLGAGGIQYPFTNRDAESVTELRRRAERHSLFVEAIIGLPSDDAGLAEFESMIRLAKDAGASVARTVMLPGRRYEQFASYAEFKAAEHLGLERLRRVEPIAAKYRFRLAVENHKDQLVAEKLATLRQIDSEYVGLCVDVGNNFRFNYETITRDALRVPILTSTFYATLPDTPAHELARMLALLAHRSQREPFIEVSKLLPNSNWNAIGSKPAWPTPDNTSLSDDSPP
jgi:hypothetical protein